MSGLLHIAPPTHRFPREALESNGGFIWWYTDVIDAAGNGLVLIWSYGLPFLPGYAHAARSGEPQVPAERPSITVAVMQDHELACFLLHELEPEDATWDGDTWRFGDSRFETRVEDGRRRLHVELNCPLPGGQQLRGTIDVDGVARSERATDGCALRHDWAPMTGPTHTAVELAAGGERYHFTGRGYFDGNVGEAPLHDTGIDCWTWGRLPADGREVIYYVLWHDRDEAPEAHGVVIDDAGTLREVELEAVVEQERLGMAGLRHPSRLRLRLDGEDWWTVQTSSVVDDGPFYLRYFIEGSAGDERVEGIGEFCRTDRIDLTWQRPLVRMRVQRADGKNSIWLPLFTGPKPGRVKRLLRGFVGR